MTTKKQAFWLATAAGLAFSAAAHADTPNPAAATLQLQVLSAVCANCHGTDGNQGGAVPVIAGRPASVLESQLLAFKRGEEPRATVMPRLTSGYTDDELAALADYFSRLGR